MELLEEKTEKQERELQKCMEEKSGPKPEPSLLEIKALKEERAQHVQTVLEKVLRKHEHQKKTRQFVTEVTEVSEQTESSIPFLSQILGHAMNEVAKLLGENCKFPAPTPHLSNDGFALDFGRQYCYLTLKGTSLNLQLYDINIGRIAQAWPEQIKGAIAIASGMKFCADQVIQYGQSRLFGCLAENVVKANPVLSMAYAVFRDLWKCRGKEWMDMRGNSREIITCLGNSLFDNVPQLSKAKPLFDAAQACDGANAGTMKCIFNNVMKDVLGCHDLGSAQAVAICLGNNIINWVPPFTFFNKIGDIVGDMIEGFARLAAGLMKQVLTKGQALIQRAVSSKFPSVGDSPMVHHESSNLMIYTHSASAAPSKRRSSSAQGMSALQEEGKPKGHGLGWNFGPDTSHKQTKLITQRLGFALETSQCLSLFFFSALCPS